MRKYLLPCCLALAVLVAATGTAQEKAAKGKRGAAKKAAAASLPANVSIEKDIVYAQYGAREVLLDLYLPKDRPAGPLPCVVVIHGGGWKTGDKQRFARHAAYLASKGFAAACIGYRLMPEATIPQCIEDAKAAVRWVRANGARYGIDPNRIGAIGGSAGAHLVAMLGTSYKVAKLEGAGGNPGVSSRVQAVVAMAAPTDFTVPHERRQFDKETATLISPVTYVDKDSAPLLLLHGEADALVPMQQSEELLAKYQAAGASAELIKNKGPHGFWNQDPMFTETMDRAVVFFRAQLK
jgi:acetyl esterase/lipase